MKSLSLPLEHIRDILDKMSYKQILISHYNYLQEQLSELQTSISNTATLINMSDVEVSLSWEQVSGLIQNARNNAEKWTDYFQENEKIFLQKSLPNLSKNDGVLQQYISVLRQIEWCIEREIAPESDEGIQIAKKLIDISNESFKGDTALMEKFWEVRKRPVDETGLYPISEEVLVFVERCVEYVTAEK